jgi:Ca-activated chloride channel family protein
LWLLLAVVVLGTAYLLLQRRRTAYAVRFATLDLLGRIAPRRPGWRRHLAFAILLVSLALLILSEVAAALGDELAVTDSGPGTDPAP